MGDDLIITIKISDDLSTLERWNKMGILEGLSDDKKLLTANSFDFTLKFLMNSEEYQGDSKFETIVFPIIRRVINEVEIGVNDLMFIIKNTKDNTPNMINGLNNNTIPYIDYEAEYCVALADELILQIKNNKKEYKYKPINED